MYLKAKIAANGAPMPSWCSRDPAFATALTAFNPFAGKDDSSQYAAMSAAINGAMGRWGVKYPGR